MLMILLFLLADQPSRYQPYEYSGKFGVCGRRMEVIEDSPYQEFRTIEQWASIASRSPRRVANVRAYESALHDQRAAAACLAEIANRHRRSQSLLDGEELEQCRAACLRLLKSENADVRGWALTGLSAIGNKQCLESIGLLERDPNPAVRGLAQEAADSIGRR